MYRRIALLLSFLFAFNAHELSATNLANINVLPDGQLHTLLRGLLNASVVDQNRIPVGVHLIPQLKPKRILFLGDAGEHSLAESFAPYFDPDQIRIYKTDFDAQDVGFDPERGLFELHLDHTKPFPFADNYFDLILGSRILCHCQSECPRAICGGLTMQNSQDINPFLLEVSRVLNKMNPHSLVLLEGKEYKLPRLLRPTVNQLFKRGLKAVSEQHPDLLNSQMIYLDNTFALDQDGLADFLEDPSEKSRFGLFIGNSDIISTFQSGDDFRMHRAMFQQTIHAELRARFIEVDGQP